ncbi:LINE-1 reverse transcriptase isogeny [Gossypium australe]|uniref:LINE-1 reverse transcriptase isogeny n=1 Tax=Gossypium australe TaxID=47621 RepID=A0A5B6W7A7_9ROSI|nr:LINE-1 reverse transcriptase isogeny [Gossypium australe]
MNIKKRLDRGAANEKWMHLFPKGNVRHLIHSISDHCPLLIHIDSEKSFKRSPRFKFEARWTLEDSFEQELKKDVLKRKLTQELKTLLEGERNDDTMAKLIDTRIRLNMEIDKDEIRINTINRLESVEGREITDDLGINETASNYFQNLFSSNGVFIILTNLCYQHIRWKKFIKRYNGWGPLKLQVVTAFQLYFSKKYWHIVGKDVEFFVLEF